MKHLIQHPVPQWHRAAQRALCLLLLMALPVLQLACSRPLPPTGKNALVIRGQQQDIYFYPAANGAQNAPKVLFLCGDGGWNGFALDIAADLAKNGYDVYGFDTQHYLESFTTDKGALSEQDVMNDLGEVAKWIQTRWRERITLVGWSEGAGLVVCAAASPDHKSSYSGVVTFGLPDKTELGWSWRDDVTYVTGNDPDEPMLDTIKYLPQVAPLPLAVIHSSGDQFTTNEMAQKMLAAAGDPKQFKIVQADNHRFDGNTDGFFKTLRESLLWTNSNPT